MLVKDVMHKNVVAASPDATIREASKVMNDYKIGSLIVMKDNDLAGIITASDIIRAVAKDMDVNDAKLEDVMSKTVVTIDPEDTIEEAVDVMLKNKIKRLPVVENGKIKGIITATNIMVVEPKLIESIASLISLKLPGLRGG